MNEFKKRVQLLETIGAEYRLDQEYRPKEPPRSPHPIQVFTAVKPPLRPQEWCHLFMSEGAFYMGGCCGTMGQLQDELCHEIRMESGWFSIRKLSEIAEVMIQHDGDEGKAADDSLTFAHRPKDRTLEDLVAEFKDTQKSVKKRPNLLFDPWYVLTLVWHITKDFYGPEIPHAFGDHMSELEKSVSLLSRGLTAIHWEHLFSNAPETKTSESQTKTNRALLLYRMLPAWKTLNEKIGELNLGPVEGFALIEKEKGPEAICTNGHGYCVFTTKAEVNKLLKLWRQQDKEYKLKERKPIDERIGVRRVRISAEKGVEFLD